MIFSQPGPRKGHNPHFEVLFFYISSTVSIKLTIPSLILAQCIRSYLFDDQISTLLLVGSSYLMTTLHRDPALEGRVLAWRTITDFDSPNDSIVAIRKH
ncbi:hypothetical protein Krac_3923 [Ktedonobacter racemifer DSM 44963]|uniref:Uncharacterized protein n=1 Tax=Ktedonobacter racemifer DSM 44963 TaxID=485913 RepID=D6U3M2_KTERA|nr:hypothetical protein Krac_3923 [Ktedonobacter racemifer DSM 44963]